MNNLHKQKLLWEVKIRKIESHYKKFMEIGDFPEYKINFMNIIPGGRLAAQVNHTKSPMELNVLIGMMVTKEHNLQATLFHEFTHILDYSKVNQNDDILTSKVSLRLYSEYHASYIEGLYLIGAENISSRPQINKEAMMIFLNRNKYLIYENIAFYNEEKSIAKWYDVLDAYMYYYASVSLCNEYLNEQTELIKFDFPCDENLKHLYYCYNIEPLVFSENISDISYRITTFLHQYANNDIN